MFDKIDYRSSEARAFVACLPDNDLRDLKVTIQQVLDERNRQGWTQATKEAAPEKDTDTEQAFDTERTTSWDKGRPINQSETLQGAVGGGCSPASGPANDSIGVRLYKLETQVQRIKEHDKFTREMAGNTIETVVELTRVKNMIFEALREHEVNIKSAFVMAEEAKVEAKDAKAANSQLHGRIYNTENAIRILEHNAGEARRAHDELNAQLNGDHGWRACMGENVQELARQVKAIQSRLAKEWDKKRR